MAPQSDTSFSIPLTTDTTSRDRQRTWPAPQRQLAAARAFIMECAAARAPTLLLPDKDADGLCSGLLVHATLLHLGLPASLISVHFPAKGSNIHASPEREQITRHGASYVIVTDQGSRGGRSIADDPETKTLVIDHHWSTEFPEGAVACSAAQCPPVATSSTLAYEVCLPLVHGGGDGTRNAAGVLRERMAWLCAMGTMGDLGTGFKWESPFPDMRDCLKTWTKKAFGEAIGLVNAPRRSAEYDVETAWRVLLISTSPKDVVSLTSNEDVKRLYEARASVKTETERNARKAPIFSGDGRVALIRISSPAQVHPLIATRWSSSLKGPRLEVVMCANDGYSPGMTNFACRIPRSRRVANGEGEVNIIATLKEYASRVPGLRETMGDDFARGHKEASGGIVRTADFERLWEVMANSERDDRGTPAKKRRTGTHYQGQGQRNTLEGWLKKT
ncbi:DHH phosphoesterase [Dichomitus squalens]|uniref:DHH phosphoesterase n=1 Tax=Dichomitus squalens TaxID=114155 RepID=A0A4Q9M5D3_9APHY|nr:DHH phosphoesterase [Dichomitus squalens]